MAKTNECKCSLPAGVSIKPDGIHELEPCFYDEIERYKNVTVSVRRCRFCGNVDIAWYWQENTEKIDVN